ncbi:hypothetical protein FQZ97_1006970 [compost metagenome]
MIEDGLLDCIINRCIISRLHHGKLFRFRVGINKKRKARIGSTDIADEDGKLETLVSVNHGLPCCFVCSYCLRAA